jgi:hypothetical protein
VFHRIRVRPIQTLSLRRGETWIVEIAKRLELSWRLVTGKDETLCAACEKTDCRRQWLHSYVHSRRSGICGEKDRID